MINSIETTGYVKINRKLTEEHKAKISKSMKFRWLQKKTKLKKL